MPLLGTHEVNRLLRSYSHRSKVYVQSIHGTGWPGSWLFVRHTFKRNPPTLCHAEWLTPQEPHTKVATCTIRTYAKRPSECTVLMPTHARGKTLLTFKNTAEESASLTIPLSSSSESNRPYIAQLLHLGQRRILLHGLHFTRNMSIKVRSFALNAALDVHVDDELVPAFEFHDETAIEFTTPYEPFGCYLVTHDGNASNVAMC